jgi:hypothetical protein
MIQQDVNDLYGARFVFLLVGCTHRWGLSLRISSNVKLNAVVHFQESLNRKCLASLYSWLYVMQYFPIASTLLELKFLCNAWGITSMRAIHPACPVLVLINSTYPYLNPWFRPTYLPGLFTRTSLLH